MRNPRLFLALAAGALALSGCDDVLPEDSGITVTLSQATATVYEAMTVQLSATVTPADTADKSVTWASGSTAVATVSSTGLVTGAAVGTATITATSVADTSKTATCTVTVAENGLLGAWQLTHSTTYDVNDAVTEDIAFPMDWIALMNAVFSTTGYDFDDDGTDEEVIVGRYVLVEGATARVYAEVSVTDDGADTIPNVLAALGTTVEKLGVPFYEDGLRYNSADDYTYTLSGNTLTTTDGDVSTFEVSGTTLTTATEDDRDTVDTADDTTTVEVYSKVDASVLAAAVEDTDIHVYPE